MEKNYQITLNETQLKTLEYVTEAFSRIRMGQLDVGFQDACESAWERDHKTPEHPYGICAPGWQEMRDELVDHIQQIRKLCWNQGRGTMYGVHYDDIADELWDMHQVLRKFRYDNIFTDEERKTMSTTVMAYSPMRVGKQPLIKIEKL